MHNINLKSEILATIDELNQYINGYVTNESILESLEELKINIKKYKFK